jgi:hypothetical protein
MPCPVRIAVAFAAVVVVATDAHAATINVTSSSAGSNVTSGCALRDAIQAVNTLAPVGKCPAGEGGNVVNTIDIQVDTIDFSAVDPNSAGAVLPAVVAGRYLNIFGNPQTRTFLLASGCGSFSYGARLLEVKSGAVVFVADVDFANGCPSPADALGGVGGAVANYGTLYLTRSHLLNNMASPLGALSPGAAVYSGPDAQFSASNVDFESNTGDGALYVDVDADQGYAAVDGSVFAGNTGSAIHNLGVAMVSNSTFADNSGLLNNDFVVAGGAVNNSGILDLSFASLLGNVYANAAIPSTQLDIGANGTAFIRSTLFGSPASQTSVNCEIADGAGVYWYGVSISHDATCAGGSNLVNTDPLLDTALADNGGPTQTLKLLAGSPAFHRDADCLDAAGDPVTADQRGMARPALHCDAGAYNDTVFFHGFDD